MIILSLFAIAAATALLAAMWAMYFAVNRKCIRDMRAQFKEQSHVPPYTAINGKRYQFCLKTGRAIPVTAAIEKAYWDYIKADNRRQIAALAKA